MTLKEVKSLKPRYIVKTSYGGIYLILSESLSESAFEYWHYTSMLLYMEDEEFKIGQIENVLLAVEDKIIFRPEA